MRRKVILSIFASIVIMTALASCGSIVTLGSGDPPEDRSDASAEEPSNRPAKGSGDADEGTGEAGDFPGASSEGDSDGLAEETSQTSAEDSGEASATVGDLIMLEGGWDSYTLTFVDTLTGDSDSRYFTLPDEGELNPAGTRGLPFNEDFTRLAVVSEWRDGQYYRSAGYVEADGGYEEEIGGGSSFEGEGGFYTATFHEGGLWVMNRDYEWVDVASGEVRGESPKAGGNESAYTDMYIGGAGSPAEYGLGNCRDWYDLPSRTASRCYESSYGNIGFFSNETMIVAGSSEAIETGDACDELLALDGEDNFYCVDELDDGRRLVRIPNGGGEALEITPDTDQEILQAIVSEDGGEVLFTARRDDDPIEAYVVPSEGGSEPRVKPSLTGYLSNEDQKFYRWAPK